MIPKNKLNYIKNKIKSNCTDCNGSGCGPCQSKIIRVSKYAKSNIPIEYWMKSFKEFKGDPKFKNLIKPYIEDIEILYKEGKSLVFVGNLGTGKSYMASTILKKAIVSGFTAKYTQMADIVNEVTKNNFIFLDEITDVDFLCVDEFDSRWIFPSEKAEQLFGQAMEKIIRTRFQNHMPTILCSNTADINNVLAGDFSRSIDSLFSKYVEIIYVSGKDFRKSKK